MFCGLITFSIVSCGVRVTIPLEAISKLAVAILVLVVPVEVNTACLELFAIANLALYPVEFIFE